LNAANDWSASGTRWSSRSRAIRCALGLKHVHRPLLLHITGHGVIGGDEESRCDTAPCVSAVVARRSMALTGIVLEGAYGRARDSHEDGLLTAAELQNLDLQGTEWSPYRDAPLLFRACGWHRPRARAAKRKAGDPSRGSDAQLPVLGTRHSFGRRRPDARNGVPALIAGIIVRA
jgi:hypothetical protein